MSTRWIHELAIPGIKPDVSSVWASYVCALVQCALMSAAFLNHNWTVELWLLAMAAFGLQLPLLLGILIAKVRAMPPHPVGNAAMYRGRESLASVGWFRAFGGGMLSLLPFAISFMLELA